MRGDFCSRKKVGLVLLSMTLALFLMTGSSKPIRAVGATSPPGLSENYALVWAHLDNDLNRIDDVIDQIMENREMVKHRKNSFVISGEGKNIRGSLIVNFTRKINENEMKTFFEIAGQSNVFKFKHINAVSLKNVNLDVIDNLSKLDGIEVIELQHRVRSLLDVSARAVKARPSTEYSDVWEKLGVDGTGVNIAILDTGVDDEHESLNGKYIAGVDCTGSTDLEFNPNDQSSYDVFHGTHVAGIAMGTGGTSGIYKGVAPGAGLIDVRVLNEKGEGTTESVIRGIEWCIANKDKYNIKVMSLSLGSDSNSNGKDAQSQAVNAAVEAGIVVVVAAGNDGEEGYINSPGAADNAITVGALFDHNTVNREDDTVASYSNRGPRLDDGDSDPYDELKPDLTAPGTYIWSAKGSNGTASNEYHQLSGTSMAAPHVAGIVALMLQANPNLTPSDVKQILHETAESRGLPYNPGLSDKYNTGFGWGIVDAYDAVQRALGEAGNPDFSISAEDISFSDNTPVVGQRVLVKITVHNLGDVDGSCDLAFYRQDVKTSFLGKVRRVFVRAGETTDVKFAVTLPKQGDYTVLVKVENASPSENNLSNNQTSASIAVGARPDSPDLTLIEYDIYFRGRLAEVGTPFLSSGGVIKLDLSKKDIQAPLISAKKQLVIAAKIHNVGNSDANCGVEIYMDNKIPENLIENFHEIFVSGASDNWISVTWEIPMDIEGDHQIIVVIENVPTDDDPGNNEASRLISFPTTITTGDIAVAPSDITFSDNLPREGEIVDVTVTVHNVGVIDVENVKLALYIDNVPTAVGIVPLIEQNSENTISIQWVAEEGYHEVGVLISIEGIKESNYGNNTAVTYISVNPSDVIPKIFVIALSVVVGISAFAIWRYGRKHS